MAIAGSQLTEVEIPHEPNNFFTFRNISGPELDEADLAGTKRAGQQFRDMPDRIVSEAMAQDRGGDEDGKRERTPEQQFRGYDASVLVRYGVLRWRGPLYDNVECNDEQRLNLDARTMDWAAREVYRRNTRPEGEAEDSGSSLSTVEA